MKVWDAQGGTAARPYFERATDIDPNFAMSYAVLGTIYRNMGEKQLANDAMLKAYERRERVTKWENFYIASHYYMLVTGELDKEMHVYEEWAKIYPHDFVWQLNLSVDYGWIGEYEKAIQLQRNAIARDASSSLSYGNLADLYLSINRPDEARAVLDQAIQAHVQDVHTQIAEYNLAFYLNDRAAMSKLLTGMREKADIEDWLLDYQASTEDYQGRLTSGRRLTAQACDLAAKEGNSDNRAYWLAAEALSQAQLGDPHAARQLMEQTIAVPKALNDSGVQTLVAFVAAHIGDLKRAKEMTDTLDKAYPRDTIVQSYWVPILRARTALTQGHAAQAVHLLDGTEVYDLGNFAPGECMNAAYVRGQALLAERNGAAAAEQFRNVLAHRGLVLNCPTGALSQLGLARALALNGDTSGSRAAYQDLFALWEGADRDFRPLQRAHAEYRALR
jgi:tetratricopeptide (TPR) repeat protein